MDVQHDKQRDFLSLINVVPFPCVSRHSFNEEADLLTVSQKGPSSISMGSPWKPFLLLSVISGLSGKKFKCQPSHIYRNSSADKKKS